MAEDEQLRKLVVAENARVREAMNKAGVSNSGVQSLIEMEVPAAGIPVLLQLMREVTHPYVKQGVIRALATRAAKGVADKELLEYFDTIPDTDWSSSDTKWVIGNTLGIIADESMIPDLVRIASERRHGKAREMVVYSLGKFRNSHVTDALLKLADDVDVYGHAIAALGNSGDIRAIPVVQSKLEDKKGWVRAAARKALKKLEKQTHLM